MKLLYFLNCITVISSILIYIYDFIHLPILSLFAETYRILLCKEYLLHWGVGWICPSVAVYWGWEHKRCDLHHSLETETRYDLLGQQWSGPVCPFWILPLQFSWQRWWHQMYSSVVLFLWTEKMESIRPSCNSTAVASLIQDKNPRAQFCQMVG